MDLSLSVFLIVCPLTFLAGFVDAIAGGGGLISLPGYLIAGLPPHLALGTNKLSSMLGTIMATYRYAKKGYINYKLACFSVIFALLGSALGARLVLLVDADILKLLLIFVIPLTALFLSKKRALAPSTTSYSFKKTVIISSLIAFFIGIYDGFYGPGTGTFLILLLVACAHMSLKDANGNTKAINLATNVAAFLVFLLSGQIVVILGLIAGICSILGNLCGALMFEKKGASVVRPIMLCVLAVFLIKLVLELVFS